VWMFGMWAGHDDKRFGKEVYTEAVGDAAAEGRRLCRTLPGDVEPVRIVVERRGRGWRLAAALLAPTSLPARARGRRERAVGLARRPRLS
jgi:hypothetical protein